MVIIIRLSHSLSSVSSGNNERTKSVLHNCVRILMSNTASIYTCLHVEFQTVTLVAETDLWQLRLVINILKIDAGVQSAKMLE